MTTEPPRPLDDPRAALHARLSPLLTALDVPLPRTRIVYRINGGPPSRRLEASLEVGADGTVTHELLDELHSSDREVISTKIAPEDARKLLREVVRSSLLTHRDTGGGFLPDSLVGSITVQSGDAAMTHYFLAHDRQRRQQALPLSPSVKRLRPRLEAIRERALAESRRSFKPPT
jgi:hypothetical protein